jgi:hypothetical protein
MDDVKRYLVDPIRLGNHGTSRAVQVVMASDFDAIQTRNKQLTEAHRIAQKQLGDRWEDIDAQRLRADTAEAELAKANEKIDRAWNRSCALDRKAFIHGALDAWKRPVPQHLPYDFSGNPGASATQYCNGWNDAGGYWRGHATEVEAKLAAAEQRIAELIKLLHATSSPVVDGELFTMERFQARANARSYLAALNPKPEAGSHE